LHISFDWSASTYKVIALLKTFPTIGHKLIWNSCNCKKIQNIYFFENLGHLYALCPFPWGTWAFPGWMYIILWESAFPSPELEPFSMEKFIASLRSCLFSKKFFISWETCLGLAFNLFFFLNYFLSTKKLFKYFTNFFIHSICWKKYWTTQTIELKWGF